MIRFLGKAFGEADITGWPIVAQHHADTTIGATVSPHQRFLN